MMTAMMTAPPKTPLRMPMPREQTPAILPT
jgi:hypothetical protein